MTDTPAVRMHGISKSFGAVHALRDANLTIEAGRIHALLGENGAGKSTLMHVLFGLIAPDAGTVEIRGVPLKTGSPGEAIAAGVGMVHQHFTQVPRMSVAENVHLGRPGFLYDARSARALVLKTGAATGLSLDPDALAGDLPIGLRQRLEIVKAIAWGARVLILDEPTATLAPSEVSDLFASLRGLAASGMAIILITHKLREALSIAGTVTVLRQGRVVLDGPAATFDSAALAAAMVGEGNTSDAPPASVPGQARAAVLTTRGLTVYGRGVRVVSDVSLDVQSHVIVGIAAVEGNGQRELMRAIAGFLPYEGTSSAPVSSVGFVPEDRQNEGLILDFSIADNLALAEATGFWLQRRYLENHAAVAIDEFGIRTPDARLPVRSLSGGNQQKVVLARVLGGKPALLVAENPTRGLDIRATAEVHAALRHAARTEGAGVLFYSTDLDEVLALADRVGVMRSGHWEWAEPSDLSRERLGALMLGAAAA